MPKNYFDKRVAKDYEARWPHLFEPSMIEPAVKFIADHADGGPVLELGVGTGRLALPLSARGLEVHGIDHYTSVRRNSRALTTNDFQYDQDAQVLTVPLDGATAIEIRR